MTATRKYRENDVYSIGDSYAYQGYTELKECRQIVNDCLSGQRTIKEKEKYLPPNEWQKDHMDEYRAFLRRALFPGETKNAFDTYCGLMSIGDPSVKLPSDGRMDYIVNYASSHCDGLKQIQMRTNAEQLSHGLRFMILDVREKDIDRPFYISEYPAWSYLNAHLVKIDGEIVHDFVLLNESDYVYDMTKFSYVPVIRFRVLGLDESGHYYQREITPQELKDSVFDYRNPPDDGRTIYPSYKGKLYNRIPCVWCGASSLSATMLDNPPLLNIAQEELKLYMCMAYHSQHIYMNTQEFLLFTGVGKDFDISKVTVGAGAGVALTSTEANAKYVSTNGVGFTAENEEINMIKTSIADKKMSLMSAKSHQSSATTKSLESSQTAPLRIIIEMSGLAIQQLLKHAANWMGYTADEISNIRYIPSDRFSNAGIDLQAYISLCENVKNGNVVMLESDLASIGKASGWITNDLPWDKFKRQYNIEKIERIHDNIVIAKAGNQFLE